MTDGVSACDWHTPGGGGAWRTVPPISVYHAEVSRLGYTEARVDWWINWIFAIDQDTHALPFRMVLARHVRCFVFRSDWPAGFV